MVVVASYAVRSLAVLLLASLRQHRDVQDHALEASLASSPDYGGPKDVAAARALAARTTCQGS